MLGKFAFNQSIGSLDALILHVCVCVCVEVGGEACWQLTWSFHPQYKEQIGGLEARSEFNR